MFKKSVLHLSLVAALLSASGTVFAATAGTSLPVSASVSQKCLISTTGAIAFGAYDPVGVNAVAPMNTSGQVSVACSKNSSSLTIGMDNGMHVSGTQRQMLGGGVIPDNLQYNLFQPPSNSPDTACTFPGTTPWSASGTGLMALSSPPSKVARVYNVCATIPGGLDVAVDSYADTITATINF